MKAIAKKWFWSLAALLILAVGGYFLTFGHCFLPLPKSQAFGGESIEIWDFEEFVTPPESNIFAQARWRFTCPGQVRLMEAFRDPTVVDGIDSFNSQRALKKLGYEFPIGSFAKIEVMDTRPNPMVFRWRIANYPTVLDRIQKDLNVKLVSRAQPRTDLMDPDSKFQKSFEQVDRIECVIRARGRYGYDKKMVEIDNWDDVRQLFEILKFVPYDKGSSRLCNCGGDEMIRAYNGNTLVGEFTIHHGLSVRWSPLGTDVELMPDSIEALGAYLDQQVYGRQKSGKALERYCPGLPLTPAQLPVNTHITIDKSEPAGAGQPATKPADKAPVKDLLPSQPSKDAPR